MPSVEAIAGGQRQAVVTDDDHGPILQIVMWFMMVAMILIAMLKLAVRFALVRDLGADDAFIVLAMFTGIGGTISLSLAVNHGLGERDSVRDNSQTSALQKNIYSASILYLLTICFAKISTLMLTKRLSPNSRNHHYVVWGVTIFSSLWGVSAVFADALRCSVPDTFDILGGDCIDIYAFWNAISAVDILTDLILIILAFWVFGGLQMPLDTKVLVLLPFACRILVIAAAIARLVYLNRLNSSSDFFFDSTSYHISTQVQQALSVIVASAPGLKQVMDRTNSGMLNISLGGHTGATYGGTHHKDTFLLTNVSKKSMNSHVSPNKDITTSISAAENGTMPNPPTLFRPEGIWSNAMVTCDHHPVSLENGLRYHAKRRDPNGGRSSTSREGGETEIDGEAGSLESHRSDQMIIKVKKAWTVAPDHAEV